MGLKPRIIPPPADASAMNAAFERVGFPEDGEPVPMPEDLTPEQRAVAVESAGRPGLALGRWAIPPSAWARRRWLGFDTGGALEEPVAFSDGKRDTAPLWRALAVLFTSDEDEAWEFLEDLELPIPKRLEIFGDVILYAYAFDGEDMPWGTLSEIDESCAEWALRYVEHLLALFADGAPVTERGWNRIPDEIRWPLFVALVRSGRPIDPNWDALLPVSWAGEKLAATRECLEAIPEPRRLRALLAAMDRRFDSHAVRIGLALLPDYPSAELCQAVLERCDRVDFIPKRKLLGMVGKLADEHPVLRPTLDAFLGKQPPRIELGCKRRLQPTCASELTAVQQAQLVAAGKLYDGHECSAEERLAADAPPEAEEQSFAGFFSLLEIVDAKGTPAYDALTYRVDSGAVFRAGTLEVVAEIVQGALECEDAALREALQSAIEQGLSRT